MRLQSEEQEQCSDVGVRIAWNVYEVLRSYTCGSLQREECRGDYVGGPMYYIKNGLGKKWYWMASVYAILGSLTVLGTGNATQVNTITTSIDSALISYNVIDDAQISMVNLVIGIVIAALVAVVLLGGVKRIGTVTEKLVPFMAVFYIILAIGVVALNADKVPHVFEMIFVGAFNPSAFTGGVVGSMFMTMRRGVSRGIFSNEAGIGTDRSHMHVQIQMSL